MFPGARTTLPCLDSRIRYLARRQKSRGDVPRWEKFLPDRHCDGGRAGFVGMASKIMGLEKSTRAAQHRGGGRDGDDERCCRQTAL